MADNQTLAVLQEILLKSRIKFVTGTEAEWTAANPVLLDGEYGLIRGSSPLKYKVGDGTKTWSALGWGNVTSLAQLTADATHRLVTDSEKKTWGDKAEKTTATTSADGLMSKADKSKLDGVAAGANNYQHPASHPASMITQDASHRFVTDSEKTGWNEKADVFTFDYNAYLHPPTGGLNPAGAVAKNIVAAINANKKCVVVAQNVAVQEIEDSISGFVSITEVSASAVTGLIDTIRMASDDSGRTVFLATASITFKSDGTVTVAAVPYTGRIVMEEDLPEYSTEKAPTVSGFAATYYLTRNGSRIGVPINIPLDQVLRGSSIKTVVTANSPYSGAKVGDKYIEFLFQNNNTPQYLPVQDLVDVYTGDDQYIQVTESNVIKLNYSVLALKLAADMRNTFDQLYDEKGAGEAAAKAAIDEFKASTFVIQCTIPGMN